MTRALRDLAEPQELVVLDVCDLAVGLSFPDLERDGHLYEAIRRHMLPAPLTAAAPTAVLQIRAGELPDRYPGDALEEMRGSELRRGADGSWQTWSSRSVAEWTAEGGTVRVLDGADPHVAALSVSTMLHDLGGRGPATPVHAGLVGDSDGAAMVIGASGQGKSSTIAAALAAGVGVASDDAVFVQPTGDEFRVRGLPRTLRVPAEVAPGEAAADGSSDYRDRVRLDDVDLLTDWLPLRSLIFVGHGSSALTTTADIARADATGRLITSVTTRFAGDDAQQLVEMLGRLSSLPRFHMQLGADPTRRVASTGDALRRILANPVQR